MMLLFTSDLGKIAGSLGEPGTWALIGVAAVAGALGGIAQRLAASDEDKTTLLTYAALGGIAAIASLYVISVDDVFKFIGASVVAGFAGRAVLTALQARLQAAFAKNQAKKSKRGAKKAIQIAREAVKEGRQIAKNGGETGSAALKAVSVHEKPGLMALDSLEAQLDGLEEELDLKVVP